MKQKPEKAAYARQWRASHPEYRKRIAETRRTAAYRAYRREYRLRVRDAIIKAYGGMCTCCGETIPEFLAIDHIYNDGAKERRSMKSGTQFYNKLRRLGYPKDRYRLLCHNCNMARAFYGKCPHEG